MSLVIPVQNVSVSLLSIDQCRVGILLERKRLSVNSEKVSYNYVVQSTSGY